MQTYITDFIACRDKAPPADQWGTPLRLRTLTDGEPQPTSPRRNIQVAAEKEFGPPPAFALRDWRRVKVVRIIAESAGPDRKFGTMDDLHLDDRTQLYRLEATVYQGDKKVGTFTAMEMP